MRQWIGHLVESRAVGLLVVFVALCDSMLVGIECGIHHQVLCINGRELSLDHAAVGEMTHRPPAPDQHALASSVSRVETVCNASSESDSTCLADADHSDVASTDSHGSHPDEDAHSSHASVPFVCEHPSGHAAHHIVHQCHAWSVTCLCILLAELLTRACTHPAAFFGSPALVFDLFVVTLSLVLDVAQMSGELLIPVASLLGSRALDAFLAFWRFLRIVHAAFGVVHREKEHAEEHVKHECQHELDVARQRVRELEAMLNKQAPAASLASGAYTKKRALSDASTATSELAAKE